MNQNSRYAQVNMFPIHHLGGETGVTGSCHLLQVKGLNIMLDCGITQGGEVSRSMDDWPIKPSQVDFLFLTHAHIDHVGRLPELIQKGFKGEIITTHPTRALLGPMLQDTMELADFDARAISHLEHCIDDLSWGFEYSQWFDLNKDIKFKLFPAGHILGSCSVGIEVHNPSWTVVFSGDLGDKNTPLLPDPEPPERADLVILESTYGNRLHEDRTQRMQRLANILTHALADDGKVFIPAFSLGRTQELLYEMDRLCSDAELQKRHALFNADGGIPVFVDSPLGLEITKTYAGLREFWDREAQELYDQGDHPIEFDGLYGVESSSDHRELLRIEGPAVIVAGSGMCTGGRIVDHLKSELTKSENDVCFVGYQAAGTAGRDIQRYSEKPGGWVKLDGNRVEINAAVHVLTGYSAHADQNGLIEWVGAMPERPAGIKLVHGESDARRGLAAALRSRGYAVL